jgi:hypothetical protein
VQAGRVARIDGQDLAIEALGFRQLTLAMMLDGGAQHAVEDGNRRLARVPFLRGAGGIERALHGASVCGIRSIIAMHTTRLTITGSKSLQDGEAFPIRYFARFAVSISA